MKYANIIVDISLEKLDKTFQYRVPEAFQGALSAGMQVNIPFGNRHIKGYVIELTDTPECAEEKLKDIEGICPKGINLESRMLELAFWMKETYGCTTNQALKTVLPAKKLVKKRKSRVSQVPDAEAEKKAPVILNEEQRKAVEAIRNERKGENRPCLLFGVTGSGKTEVYMQVIEEVMAEGKQAILLIPEIALTFQNLQRFHDRFGTRIGILNSRLSAGEKTEVIRKAADGEIQLVIGPRSALFTPFPDLGVIIIDEEHEGTYHSETMPRYRSCQVAEEICRMTGAGLVLGSATPSMESYYRCQKGEYLLAELKQRGVSGSRLPKVEIVDLREELKEGNKSIFSRSLSEKIKDRISRKEQVMLFLNRRGYAGFVSCRSCGTSMKCPHCSVSLSIHRDRRLHCHYCGYQTELPDRCPSCGSPYIASFGTGTQKVETIVQKAFPEARVLRMDADTTARKDGHSRILSVFKEGEADILVGTQMIVKGHDFPRVTLVGILAADLSLYTDDFRASERTFQLLTQAAGRAGRGAREGEVVIQTYVPEHYAVIDAAQQNYEAFYKEEMAYRELMNYPPAGSMLMVMVTDANEERCIKKAAYLRAVWERRIGESRIKIVGPAAAGVSKKQDLYRQVLYVKSRNPEELKSLRKIGEAVFTEGVQYDIL